MCETESGISWMWSFTCRTDWSKSALPRSGEVELLKTDGSSLPDSVPLWRFPRPKQISLNVSLGPSGQCLGFSFLAYAISSTSLFPSSSHLLFLKPYIKTFKWSVGQGRVFWSYLTVSCYRLMQPIAILLLASSEEAPGNCSSLVHKKQPSCMLVTQLQHSIQLSGHYHCLSLYSWIFGFCVLAQILHRAFTGNIAWHYKIKTISSFYIKKYKKNTIRKYKKSTIRSNRKPQTASLEIQSYSEKRSTGPLNATEIPGTAWVKPCSCGIN